MKNIGKLVIGSALAVSIFSSGLLAVDMDNANPQKGQKIYQALFYKACGITCNTMAKKYTQNEWENAYKAGKVQDLMSKHCSIMEDLTTKEQRVIYDYMYYHAKDSGHVAPCED